MHEHPSLFSFRPIADHGLLSDCNSAALVDPAAAAIDTARRGAR